MCWKFVLSAVCFVCALSYYFHVLFWPISPFIPREKSYSPYEHHYQVSGRFPFVSSYYLMFPRNYNPEEKYPLVMMLHGGSRHMYGGKVLKRSSFRENYSAIVYIPIAPTFFNWGSPKKLLLRPKAMPIAMDGLSDIRQKYSVDENRIYITGYSMGGAGTFSALRDYHDVFAAGAPTDASWPSDDIPVWYSYGRHDRFYYNTGLLVTRIKKNHPESRHTEYRDIGHGAWIPVYEDRAFWDWLFQQRKDVK